MKSRLRVRVNVRVGVRMRARIRLSELGINGELSEEPKLRVRREFETLGSGLRSGFGLG